MENVDPYDHNAACWFPLREELIVSMFKHRTVARGGGYKTVWERRGGGGPGKFDPPPPPPKKKKGRGVAEQVLAMLNGRGGGAQEVSTL